MCAVRVDEPKLTVYNFNDFRLVAPLLSDIIGACFGSVEIFGDEIGSSFRLEIPIDPREGQAWVTKIVKEVDGLSNSILHGAITTNDAIRYLTNKSSKRRDSSTSGTFTIQPLKKVQDIDTECGLCPVPLGKDVCVVKAPNGEDILLCTSCGKALEYLGFIRKK